MDVASHQPQRRLSSLGFEITTLQAKNVELKSHGNLFVRYYLSAGKNKRVQLNTREISSRSNLSWNQSFSLECPGTEQSISSLKQASVVFELRWRSTKPMLGKMGGSHLLGRNEASLKTVMESADMEIEQWLQMSPISKKSCVLDHGLKPPSVLVSMRFRAAEKAEVQKQKKKYDRSKNWYECEYECCRDHSGCRCEDYEIFALAAALEAL
ncbi:hypothetical protein K2173_005292 [Erythroxylum novogranatense]|uniref:C2 domain-containing protein n=1 Tax=Erythroxylum novogranatense TaxID=1862640 RepID=A0AAV8TUC2_9ROSI|nr:hypothetical protein K2173_005292 [Erythroxylum novogranatense]